MKSIFTKKTLLILSLIFFSAYCNAQYGLDTIIVEKYYVSNADDSIGSVGTLPVGSVTYRVFLDMRQGYTFQMAYGNSSHRLTIKTTTSFFNNEDRGSTSPNFSKTNAKYNSVMLDSWLTAGAACVGNYGILKSEDNAVANVVNADGILQSTNPTAGIPLTTRDGLIAGTPGTVGFIGVDTELPVFDATSQFGNSFTTTNGAWYCLAGATGYDTTNKVLIGQFTTDGVFSFKLNIQLGTPSGGTELYVADSATGSEIQSNQLAYLADTSTVTTSVETKENNTSISVSPNPSSGVFHLNISKDNLNTENSYTVYNLVGAPVLYKRIAGNKEKIDLTSMPNGIYFITVSINSDKRTYKLVKNQ